MIYLDNAATTLMKPECVGKSVYEAIMSLGNCGRGAHLASLSASRMIYDARETIADFFGFSYPERVCFTLNSTESLNMAIKGIKIKGGIVTSMTEHNSVLRPVYELSETGRELYIAKCSKDGVIDIEDMLSHIDENTAFVVINHASNVTGNVNDICKIGKKCRQYGVKMIVDASQTAGHININMKRDFIDILCFTGHKGLFGPQGTGGILVDKDVKVEPLKSGGTGVLSTLKNQPANYPEHLEAGTLNSHGIAGLLTAVKWIRETGEQKVADIALNLSNIFYDGIKEIDGVKIYGDFNGDRVPVVSINVRDYDSAELGGFLYDNYGIFTRSGIHCAPLIHKELGTEKTGAVRFSFSYFNTEKDVETAIEAVRKAAK